MAPTLDERTDAIAKDILALALDVANDEPARKKLFGIIMMSMARVELPIETIWRMIMSPHAPAALEILIQMGVVKDLAEAGKPKTAKELSAATGGDTLVIVRMMRPLCCLGVFREVDVQTYASTPVSELLNTPTLMGGYQFMFEASTRSLANMPKYLKKTGYKHVDGTPGPFQDAHNTQDGMFQWLINDPPMMTNFNSFMAGTLETRKDWFEQFPVNKILLDGAKKDPESTLWVDVAGGEGHDLQTFHRTFPRVTGKLILQDLPPTIDNIKSLDPAIIRQKYDFFTPQPVKGARAYFFRNIFHDWPEKECVSILKNIVAAMTPGYSKVLIFEWILPAKNVPLYPALLDINMMAILNGMERTEAQWTTVLNQAGLEVVKFWKTGDESEGLIEAIMKK
ncbi:hypothetical protein B7494_g2377 [Chlorociboria aeruginascens]|nr:hypothetical protein B7494_g2377 [Chlorociboria aeruginascens]